MIAQNSTQCKRILEHLRMCSGITPLEALELYGCFRLGARIHELRKEGHVIDTKIVEKNGKRFALYILKEEANEQ